MTREKTATAEPAFVPRMLPEGCVSLIGMAGSGKSTIGRELAAILRWRHLDSDRLMEAQAGATLQTLADSMDQEEFLDLEARTILAADLKGVVLSTGGSAVYRRGTMEHLARLGPVINLDVPWPVIAERLERKPDRGLAKKPGQTFWDLYQERRQLYRAAASHTVRGGAGPARQYAREIADWLRETDAGQADR